MRSISKDVIQRRLREYGGDILRDEAFYQDLPPAATVRISRVFKNNTYLIDGGGSDSAERYLEGFNETRGNVESDEKHAKILLGIKKQFAVMKYVEESHA
jgi:hypothetical protein